MDFGDDLPNPIVTDNLYKNVEDRSNSAREATLRLNEMSDQYRSTMLSINDKVILLSAGSISLLLTFLGILFNAKQDVSGLKYWFALPAACTWVLSIIFLLISRWNQSLYLFSLVHGHYLTALMNKTQSEIDLYEVYPNLVKPKSLERYSKEEITKIVKKGKNQFKMIEEQSKKTKDKETFHNKLNKLFTFFGHLTFVAGYVFAILFFLGVISLLTK
jgi:hypothetical protein